MDSLLSTYIKSTLTYGWRELRKQNMKVELCKWSSMQYAIIWMWLNWIFISNLNTGSVIGFVVYINGILELVGYSRIILLIHLIVINNFTIFWTVLQTFFLKMLSILLQIIKFFFIKFVLYFPIILLYIPNRFVFVKTFYLADYY